MDKSLTHSGAERAMAEFRRMTTLAEETGVVRQLIEDAQIEGEHITIKGNRVANFGVCSYLGLSDDDRLIKGAMDALRRYGSSYSSSIAYTAVPLYRDLSERFEEIFDAKVVIGATTTLAHFAGLPVMVRPHAAVLVDGQAHASILAVTPTLEANGARVRTVKHNDLEQLESAIAEYDSDSPVWYLTDGVFSMFGDTAPAEELHNLLDRHPNLHIYCDDAHGFGWDGRNGMGNHLARAGWHDRLVVVVGLAKSFGTMGGVLAMKDADMVKNIRANGGPLVFGGPIPPAVLGASIASADIHLSPEISDRQSALRDRMRLVNRLGSELGLRFARTEETPIWFLELGPTRASIEMAGRMLDSGFYLNPSAFPVVPRGRAGVRFTVTNHNSIQSIEGMLTRLHELNVEMFGETAVEVDLTDQASSTPAQATAQNEESQA